MELGKITTVLGDIEPNKLGFCQSHEHISIARGYSYQVNPDLCIDDFSLTKKELESFYRAGGRAVVDAQPIGCGRQADMIEKLSMDTGVSVISSTGFHKMQFYPDNHWIFKLDEDTLADLFIAELLEGMFIDCDTADPLVQKRCCAGQIKTALDVGDFNVQYRKLFSAAAKAANRTGAAIMIHVEKDSEPLVLAEYLQIWGVEPSQMIFCHMDRMIPNLEVHKSLCRQGAYMEYDTIAREQYHDNPCEIKMIKELINVGFENQLLLGLDVTRARMTSYGGTPGLTYMAEQFVPLLLENGVSQSIINKILVSNPASAFTVKK